MKTQLTLDIEKTLYYYCLEQNFSVIEEVSLPHDLGIVDTLALEYRSLSDLAWRCYEIKVTKSDFHSKARLSFNGNYNYFVVPLSLYEKIAEEIPDKIGAIVYQPFVDTEADSDEELRRAPGFLTIVKKPARKEADLALDEFFPYFLTSLQREVTKAKLLEKGPAIYDTDRLYGELKKRLETRELQGKLLADLADSRLAQLEAENDFLQQQLQATLTKTQASRRHTRPLL